MTWIMVDVEADGPIPGDYSMVQIGAVVVDREGKFNRTFYGQLKPISDNFLQSSLDVFGVRREQTLEYDDPTKVMQEFSDWIDLQRGQKRAWFIADNNGFDWMFTAWYFHHFLGENPFGHSSYNLNSLYKGMVKNTFKNFLHLKETEHTHHPVDDARGNAEAFYHLITQMGLKASLTRYD